MRRVNSDALGTVWKALGLTGQGAELTEMPDGILDQVVDVGPMIRRGRTQATTEGIYTPVLRNIHTDAESLSSSVTPYDVPGAIAPYPSPMPQQFDVWLLGASVHLLSGAGTLSAFLTVNWVAANQGWGIDDSAAPIGAVNIEKAVARWDAIATVTVGVGLQPDGNPWARLGVRLPRAAATSIIFRSKSSVTATFDCQLMIGVFPVGMGQDGLG